MGQRDYKMASVAPLCFVLQLELVQTQAGWHILLRKTWTFENSLAYLALRLTMLPWQVTRLTDAPLVLFAHITIPSWYAPIPQSSAPKAPPMRVLQTARSVQLASSPLQLAPHRARNALVATFVQLAHRHGLVSTAAAETTAPTALVLQRPAPTKCLLLADGALSKSKALHSSWKQPTASITASGTLRQATACSAHARPMEWKKFLLLSPTVSPTNIAHAPPAHLPRSRRAVPQCKVGLSNKKA